MIIVITNRKLPQIPDGQPVLTDVSALGDELGDRQGDEDIIYCGLLTDDNKINFQAKGSESPLFENIAQAELNKPWVFFVHGFNQDPQSNMDKARDLSKHHGVNVIAFAWPSHPLDESMDWDDARNTVIKGLFKGLTGSAILTNLLIEKVTSFLKDKWKNYPPAIANAENSKNDLLAALTLINNNLKTAKPPVLLVHSMGNYLLENCLSDMDTLPMKFSNVVMHQADATSPGYTWIKKLNACLDSSAKFYVTINAPDYVLGASTARRAILGEEKTERIGQVCFGFVEGNINYLDFTDGIWVDNEHEFFRLSKDKTNDYVFECLDNILKAKPDQLPTENSKSSAGFTKMPTTVSLYRLEDLIHPADEDERLEDIVPIKSLDEFNRKLQGDNDNGLNGDEFYE